MFDPPDRRVSGHFCLDIDIRVLNDWPHNGNPDRKFLKLPTHGSFLRYRYHYYLPSAHTRVMFQRSTATATRRPSVEPRELKS